MIRFHCIPFAAFFPGAVPDPRPLAFSNHRALSGTSLPNLSDFPSPYLFALWKVLYLAFHFLVFFLVVIIIFLISNDHLASYTCIFPLSQHLCWLISVSPGPFPLFPALHPLNFLAGFPSERHQDKFGGWAENKVRIFFTSSLLPLSLISSGRCVLLLLQLPLGSLVSRGSAHWPWVTLFLPCPFSIRGRDGSPCC